MFGRLCVWLFITILTITDNLITKLEGKPGYMTMKAGLVGKRNCQCDENRFQGELL